MLRSLFVLVTAVVLSQAFGLPGLLAALALSAGALFSKRFLRLALLLSAAALLVGWATLPEGKEKLAPAVPYRLLDFRWPEEELPVRIDLGGLRDMDGIAVDEGRTAARRAMESWNRVAARALLAEGSGRVRTVVRDCGESASADTRIRFSGGQPAGAVVCLNDPRAAFSTSGAADAFDLETILLHEFGHVLGLGHPVRVLGDSAPFCEVGQPDRVMCPRRPGAVTRSPLAGDIAGISALYG